MQERDIERSSEQNLEPALTDEQRAAADIVAEETLQEHLHGDGSTPKGLASADKPDVDALSGKDRRALLRTYRRAQGAVIKPGTVFADHNGRRMVAVNEQGTLKHERPKVKGKAARRADKRRRRELRERAKGSNIIVVDDPTFGRLVMEP